jgi:hypothetical protein
VAKVNPALSGPAALVYATYLGGSRQDRGYGIAVDGATNAYVTGSTRSTDFSTTPGAFQPGCGGCPVVTDTFVAKMDLRVAAGLAAQSAPSPSAYGQVVTFTATLTPLGALPAPSGAVSFTAGAFAFGPVPVPVAGGQAAFAIAALPVGSHPVTATYRGDVNYSPAQVSGAFQVVQPASTTVALAGGPNPAQVGQAVTFTATVGVVAPGGGVPTGTVSFYDGSSLLGTGTLAGGVGTYSTSALGTGAHAIAAAYSGTSNFAASSSAPLSIQVGLVPRIFLPAVVRR